MSHTTRNTNRNKEQEARRQIDHSNDIKPLRPQASPEEKKPMQDAAKTIIQNSGGKA